MASVRINPFSPNRPLPDAGLFAGRSEELRRGYQFVVQAAAGNPTNLLITGPRGIGKSTLARAVVGLAKVEQQYLRLLEVKPDPAARALLVGTHIAQIGETADDIAATWTAVLKRQTSISVGMHVDEAEISVLMARVRIRRDMEQEGTVASRLVDILEGISLDVRAFADGIVLYVDELDQIAAEPAVAPFLKVLCEQLAHRGLRNVAIVAVGQEDLAGLLLEGHASSGRLFEQIHLEPFKDDEVRDLIDTGLLGSDTHITDDAAQAVIAAAHGFPSTVQLMAHETFTLVGDRPATLQDGVELRTIEPVDVADAIRRLVARGQLPAQESQTDSR